MIKKIQAVRGMNDILPEQIPYWHMIEKTIGVLCAAYDYREIRFPIVEQTELFKHTIGEATDIVEKEMYTFEDRNGDSLSLRPEGTTGCVRAGIEQGLLHNQIQRFWYIGPMFRHERPQKGRYRQFQQFGVEAFGMLGPDIDVEQILMVSRLWNSLGLKDKIKLQINSLGDTASRLVYRRTLVAYFEKNKKALDEDSLRRLVTNPLRILDSKNPDMRAIISLAPKLLDYLDDKAKVHFEKFCHLLDAANIAYEINPKLVRGLDYYCFTVYEWVTDHLGAQNTVCAGGRYDTLVEQLGGKPTPAVGFAMGLERLVILLGSVLKLHEIPQAYLVMVGEKAKLKGLMLAEVLRDSVPNLRLVSDCVSGTFKNQLKRADKSEAQFALILGEDEVANDKVTLKYLRDKNEQKVLTTSQLINFLIAQN